MQTFAEISAVRGHLKTFKREGRKIASSLQWATFTKVT